MTQIKNAKLEWNDVGTPVSEQFDDVYFSNVNGLNESRYVFIEQNQLPDRLFNHPREQFVVAETGFGTGLNFLALWEVYQNSALEHRLPRLHFISFEKFPVTPEDLVKAHQRWPELGALAHQLQKQYPIATAGCHRLSFMEGKVTLDLWFGDIKECLPKVPNLDHGLVDAWFLDGFAPSKNPDMWSQELFNGMVDLGRTDCTVATFTAAGFVRRGLIDAGFEMKKAKGFGTKRDMLVGRLPQSNGASNIAADLPRLAMHSFSNSLTEPQTKTDEDIAIVGGGIASLTLAHSLLKRGKKVTIYCKDEQFALGASKNRQGALYPLLSSTHPAIHELFCSAFQYAVNYYEMAANIVDFEHDWSGVVQLKWNEKNAIKLDKISAMTLPDGLVKTLNSTQTDNVTGLSIGMDSLHFPMGGWLAPQQLVVGLSSFLQQKYGLVVHLNSQVTELKQTTDWQLSLSNGAVYHHQSIVVANGHLFDELFETSKLPLSKVKGQVSSAPTTSELSRLKTVLCYEGYLTPKSDIDNCHRIGASYERNKIDEEFDELAQLQNRQKLLSCLPKATWATQIDVSENISRQGVRCVSRDHLPLVGSVSDLDGLIQNIDSPNSTDPYYKNLFVFLGLGSRGLTSAPLLAEVLASQMCDEPMPLSIDVLEAIDPSRSWVRRIRRGRPIV
jgi:tRNA 5-methylaminomethyl-2-thiouridine biosynthesis bifunctional protein